MQFLTDVSVGFCKYWCLQPGMHLREVKDKSQFVYRIPEITLKKCFLTTRNAVHSVTCMNIMWYIAALSVNKQV